MAGHLRCLGYALHLEPQINMLSRVPKGRARPAGWAALALVTLIAGFADLSRGGMTLAVVLLVAGYCAVVPLAILSWPDAPRSSRRAPSVLETHHPSYAAAGLAAAAVFLLYLATLAPTTAMWDASEYIAAVKVLGLPHPPGNPVFMLLGHFFGLLPIPVSYAERVNILAALASALSAGFWFLIAERALVEWLPERWRRLMGGAIAVLVGATAFTVWNQSVVNEKVYTVSLLGLAIISWLMVLWSHAPDAPRAGRLLVLVAYLLGLGYANHPAGFIPIPAVVLAILVRRPSVLLRWRLVAGGVVALVIGLTPFMYEPVRAAYFPIINEGEPTACAAEFRWSCTLNGATLEKLKANVMREQYGKPSVLERQAPYTAQVGMWWLYFKWQWLRDAYDAHPVAQSALGVLFLLLGLLGGYQHWRRDRPSFWYFGMFMFTLTLALIFYLNFKYGWSQAQELGGSVPREVRDRDYFYLWSFSAWGVWVSLGLVSVWRALADALVRSPVAFADRGRGAAGGRGWLIAAPPVLIVACIPLLTNARQASRAGQTFTREWAADVLNSVEPYAIIVTNGDNDTFPLWYAQEVEGLRKDVIVGVFMHLSTDWFVRQLIRRPVAEYDAAKGPAIYRDKQWKKPSGPPLRMTFEEADAIPHYLPLREPMRFAHGELSVALEPGYLTRDQLVVLHMIKDAFPERPIYFMGGGYAQALGLGPYLLTQGLVQKLMPAPLAASPDTLALHGGFLDVARTRTLWNDVYGGPRALIRENAWVDRASAGVALNYVFAGELLSRALVARGGEGEGEARSIAATIDSLDRAARLREFLGGASP